MNQETYLGDGLYASFDGWMLTLKAPREDGEHWVGLEPEVLEALLQFVESIKKKRQAP
jgi:hypothetical protein